MNKLTPIAAFILSLGLGIVPLKAAEHPEHPTAAAGHEHPKGDKEHSKEHPKEHPKKSATDKAFQNTFENVVKDYVTAESEKTGGAFVVKDDVLNKEWRLKLDKVHKSKICMLEEGKACFACADFKEVDGKNKLDLDFYANKSEDGTITIDKVILHKVNGKKRFTYNEKNEMVPVK